MERSLKIAWMKRFMHSSNASWKIIPSHAISQFGGFEFFSKGNFDRNLINLDNLPEFYRTILTYWQHFKSSGDVEEMSVLKQIIWNNDRNIRIDGKPIFYTFLVPNGYDPHQIPP